MANPWEKLLEHERIEEICVPPPPPGAQDELWRLTEEIPCTGSVGVESIAADGAAKLYTQSLVAVPSGGSLPIANYFFWSAGSGNGCRAPKQKPDPELDEIRQPTEEKLCGNNQCEEHDLRPGCPYDFPIMRSAKAIGEYNPGCFVLRVNGKIVFNRVPVITTEPPGAAPGPRGGVHPTAYHAELTPSSVCDLQTKCTTITYAEGYDKPGGLDNV